MVRVSIICPVYNEAHYIDQCMASMLGQDFPQDQMEIIVVDGMSDDGTREKIKKWLSPQVLLLDNPDRITPTALNIGIKQARGEIIMRIDAHADYPVNYVSALTTHLVELEADNVGGVCKTLPANNSSKARAIAAALGSLFGMGNSYFRIGASHNMAVDTVPFGCFRYELFERIGLFDVELIRNQDDEFNGRIIRSGGKIFLVPSVVVNYYARENLTKVGRMFFQYGLFKPLVNSKLGRPATIRQFFPPLFVLAIVIGAFLALLSSYFLCLYAAFWSLYLSAALWFSFLTLRSPEVIPWMVPTFLTIHLNYGVGYWLGLFHLCLKQTSRVEVSR